MHSVRTLLVVLFFLFACHPAEANYWELVSDIPIQGQLVETGDDEHQIYYAVDAYNRHCLIYVCHGSELPNGKLGVYVDGKVNPNYKEAVERSILKHSMKGELHGLHFECIYLLCCHIGLGEMEEWSDTFNCPFIHTFDYKKTVAVIKRRSKANPEQVIGLELYYGSGEGSHFLRLANCTGKMIDGVFCTSSDRTDWGGNLLGQGNILSSGESIDLQLPSGARYCDVKVTVRGWDSYVRWKKIDTSVIQAMSLWLDSTNDNLRALYN